MVKMVCSYCGSSWNIEDDHVIPSSRGGVKTVPSCRACNRSRGDSTYADWLDRIKKEDPYRWRRITKHQKGRRSSFAGMVSRRRKKK